MKKACTANVWEKITVCSLRWNKLFLDVNLPQTNPPPLKNLMLRDYRAIQETSERV